MRPGPCLLCFAAASAMVLTGAAMPLAAADPSPDDLVLSEIIEPGVGVAAKLPHFALGWLDDAERTNDPGHYDVFDILRERQKAQMTLVLLQAGAHGASAPEGSPARQVGAFFHAYMDTATRDAAGITPLRPKLDAIAAVQSLDELMRLIGALATTDGPLLLAVFGPMQDLVDSERYAIYGAAGEIGMPVEVYNDAPGSPRIAAYRSYLAEMLEIAGYAPAEAGRIADLAIAIETELHAAKLNPIEAADPRNIYNSLSFADLQTQIPELDLSLYFEGTGYPLPDRIIQTEPRYLPVLSQMLRERPLGDFKDYAALMLILKYQSVLTTAFEEPTRALLEALTGASVLPPREERALALVSRTLGHPVSRLYVEGFFSEADRAKAVDMIARIRDVFATRLPTLAWLSEPARAAALEKLGALTIRVGYPDEWIDYREVELDGDPVANLSAIARYENDRLRAKFAGLVDRDAFADSRRSLPSVVNVSYDPLLNGIEIPAAVLQPPIFETYMDAPVYFCRIGAIIGHEMTHGFDSSGRRFDAAGDLRDWWTRADSDAFDAEALKLIDQAAAFASPPGPVDGRALDASETMSDIGGLTLASEALRLYLADHPEEDVAIDGLTPVQRCFLAWAHMWSAGTTDELFRTFVATGPQPVDVYRVLAPLQHLDAFHQAFAIKPGDAMWLPPEHRVDVW